MAQQGQGGGATAPAVPMDEQECRELLAGGRWGMLAVVGDEGPYAIPMAYGWDGEALYIGVSEGLKTALLDRDPRCSFTVCETGGGEAWRSVIVAGTAAWLSTPEERMKAGQALRRQHAPKDAPPPPPPPPPTAPPSGGASAEGTPASTKRFSGGRMLQIVGARITGRAKR